MKLLVLVLALAACHHDAPAQGPADKPPLPPASGTPIGFLIDGAGDLHLRDDQLAQLHDIDTTLAARLGQLDAAGRAAQAPAAGSGDASQSMQGGRGRHGGGMGGMGRGGHGGGRHRNPDASQQHPDAAAPANQFADVRASEVRNALHRAFDVLDPDQREPAKKLLADHDIDVDDDTPAAAPPQGSADPDVPAEP